MSLERFHLQLPRHAFGPRETARAGDVWRLLQEAAVQGSSARGWTPARYREEGTAFIVRRMTAVHHREAVFGEPLPVRTWVSTFRRGLISHREVRVGPEEAPIVSSTQEWVHVRVRPALAPCRAPAPLVEALEPLDLEPHVHLPAFDEAVGDWEDRFAFPLWHTTMDPLAHANHPAYVDWCDEALARRLAAAGHDPQGLVPVAETVLFRSGAMAPEQVTVVTTPAGHAEEARAFHHRILGEDGRTCAEVTTLRRHADGLGCLDGVG